jgi:hypothetical protein
MEKQGIIGSLLTPSLPVWILIDGFLTKQQRCRPASVHGVWFGRRGKGRKQERQGDISMENNSHQIRKGWATMKAVRSCRLVRALCPTNRPELS